MKFVTLGLALGIYAALSPGPLLALMIAETLRGSWKNGAWVSIAPLFSDIFIASLAILVLRKLPVNILGFVSIIGGFFVIYLGIRIIFRKVEVNPPTVKSSFWKGFITNTLNPHPYFFWFIIGGPLAITAYQISIVYSILFIISFYLAFIGLKVGLAVGLDKGKNFLSSRIYRYALVASGIFLIGVGFFLIYSGATEKFI